MADKQYDMSRKMQELFQKKLEQRTAAKEFWKKQVYNPYLQKEPFDPVILRYIGLSAYSAEHYRPNLKRKISLILFLAPFVGLYFIVNSERTKRENLWSSGRVAYEDRSNKLMY